MNEAGATPSHSLLAPWTGPYGGTPPFDRMTPSAIEAAMREAMETKRRAVRAIAEATGTPTFSNTIETLERSGSALRRAQALFRVATSCCSGDEMRAVQARVLSLVAELDDETAHDARIFARVDAVHARSADLALSPLQRRLLHVVREDLMRRGAGKERETQARLAAINARLATLQSRFTQNLAAEEETHAVFIDDEAQLGGLSESMKRAARTAAAGRGRHDAWAIVNSRAFVWPALTQLHDRHLRERVWRMWVARGANEGPLDNRPVVAEILRLRGEKARLLGFESFAHLQVASRMMRDPQRALDLLARAWKAVLPATRSLIEDLRQVARRHDEHEAGHGDVVLEPWDRRFHLEQVRRERFAVDTEAPRPYLEVGAMTEAMLWAAGQLFDLTFRQVDDVPTWHDDVRVFEVSRAGAVVGLIAFDLFLRSGKSPGLWSLSIRGAESFDEQVLPFALVSAGFARSGPDDPILLTWQEATVLFHEFGHALHMLSYEASYPSLDSLRVAWDVVELPALLNERWIFDRTLLDRFARHHETGQPIPQTLIERLEALAHFDRIFSLNVEYLGPAIVDMRLHLAAGGDDVDALAIEAETYEELGMPHAIDPLMRVPHLVHSFGFEYAAAVYVYLWGDVMAADIAEAFLESPGGLLDRETALRYRRELLSVGHSVPADEAFRRFRGRDPDPAALFRRFALDVDAT